MERKRSVRRQRRYRRPWLKKCKEFLRQFIAFLFSNVGIILLVVGYTIAGSFIFMEIEGKRILKMKQWVLNNRTIFVERLWNTTYELNQKVTDRYEYNRSIDEILILYQKVMVNFTRKGYDGTDDLTSSAQWSFAGAFLYSLTVITTIAILHLCTANDAPIIGILTQPTDSYDVDTYIAGSYVKFLESAGARVLPIWLNQSLDYYERVVNYTNGVLFPGGGAPFDTPGGYGETAWKILHLAKVRNENGLFYPIWGTCLGLEVFPYAEIAQDIRIECSIPDGAYPINFTEDFRRSKLFSNIRGEVFNILLTQNVTYNAHSYCLTKDSLVKAGLDTNWHVLSTNHDVNNLQFISAMEHIRYPFYGIQFHPEKNTFEFKDNQGFPHSENSVLVMQYFSNYFVTEARKTNNRFPSRELEAKSLIYNYCPQFTGLQDKYFYQIYGFEKEDYTNILQ